jgi:nucleotide-binding universal stress UspA family protein
VPALPARKETAMYKHILVPTDGSKLSVKAIRAAARLAKICGARITGVYVIAPDFPPVYAEGTTYGGLSARNYKEIKEKEAKKALAVVDIEAQTSGLQASAMSLTADQPWKAIIGAARSKKCDLIVMASHGRRGLSALLLGSETAKVLTHSKIPVLVCR